MPLVEESQIDSFSEHPEVRRRAKDLLKTARIMTNPGTGYDIREGRPGLPAICALLACEEYVIRPHTLDLIVSSRVWLTRRCFPL